MRETCWRCYRLKSSCLCPLMRPFDPGFKVVILYHPLERKRPNGTGRLAKCILLNSELLEGIDFTHHPRVQELIQSENHQCFVLYPGKESIQLNEHPELLKQQKKSPVLFVIDGSWSCAKKMMKLSRNLQQLPRISFQNQFVSQYIIRKQPHEACLSTIESLFQVIHLHQNEQKGEHHNLLEVFHHMVHLQIEAQKNPPNPTYRNVSKVNMTLVRKSKKWETRSLFFEQ